VSTGAGLASGSSGFFYSEGGDTVSSLEVDFRPERTTPTT